jgi:cobalamin synthase
VLREPLLMDEWKKVIEWAAQEQQDEKRKDRQRLARTLQMWPLIAVAVVPFAILAFYTLDPMLGTISTICLVIASVLVAEHIV